MFIDSWKTNTQKMDKNANECNFFFPFDEFYLMEREKCFFSIGKEKKDSQARVWQLMQLSMQGTCSTFWTKKSNAK